MKDLIYLSKHSKIVLMISEDDLDSLSFYEI